MIDLKKRITGISLPKNQFKVHETFKEIDADVIFEVLKGNLVGYRIREYLSSDVCSKIVHNFWNCSKKVPRYGYGEDGVEGYFVGASHIEKTTLEYLEEAKFFEESVENLYQDAINPIATFREKFASCKKEEIKKIRPASFNGLSAGDSKAVYWNNLGDFLLLPHDDFAQLTDPRQKGFEIQQVNRVMAVNFYAEVPSNAGQLKVWNIEPDDESRAALNLTHSGFPYPEELLESFESTIIPVETGDLCVINGNLVHAVLRGNPTASAKKRLLITSFITFNGQGELIWWT